jgi:hypothetical protein
MREPGFLPLLDNDLRWGRVQSLLSRTKKCRRSARAGPVKLIAIGCFVIGAAGIAAWTISNQSNGRQVSTRGAQSPGVISGGDATVSYGTSPAAQPGSLPADAPKLPSPSGMVRTEGNQSPSVIAGGKVGVEYPPTPPAASLPSGTR